MCGVVPEWRASSSSYSSLIVTMAAQVGVLRDAAFSGHFVCGCPQDCRSHGGTGRPAATASSSATTWPLSGRCVVLPSIGTTYLFAGADNSSERARHPFADQRPTVSPPRLGYAMYCTQDWSRTPQNPGWLAILLSDFCIAFFAFKFA